jgi:hypothetical protein
MVLNAGNPAGSVTALGRDRVKTTLPQRANKRFQLNDTVTVWI